MHLKIWKNMHRWLNRVWTLKPRLSSALTFRLARGLVTVKLKGQASIAAVAESKIDN
jgi:hypothetical protein